MKDDLCPKCGARLVHRAVQSDSAVEDQSDETDVDHEFKLFECGYTVVDGDIQTDCGRWKPRAS
jgi:hypothetical protein